MVRGYDNDGNPVSYFSDTTSESSSGSSNASFKWSSDGSSNSDSSPDATDMMVYTGGGNSATQTALVVPLCNIHPHMAFVGSQRCWVTIESPTLPILRHYHLNDGVSPHTRKDGFASDNMPHGMASYGDFTPRDENERFRLEADDTIGPTEASIDWDNFTVIDTVMFDETDDTTDLPPAMRLADFQAASSRHIEVTQPASNLNNGSSGDANNYHSVIMTSQLPEEHFRAPHRDGPLPNGMRFSNGFGLHGNGGPLQTNESLQVHTMQYNQGYGPVPGAGNNASVDNAPLDNSYQYMFAASDTPQINQYSHDLASRASPYAQASPMTYSQGHEASAGAGHNDLGTADYTFAFDDGASSYADFSMPGFDNSHASGASGYANYDIMSNHFDPGAGNSAYGNMASHGHDQDSGDETASDNSFEMLAPLSPPPPMASFESDLESRVKKEGIDDTYVDDDDESDYADEPERKRKRKGTKTSVETEKRNKDGQPRKSRAKRAPLRRWDENDLIKALLGIVWSCGEAGLQIPFDQAAQLIDDTCTASALQQAILKLHAQMIKEGKQLPKIKMHWPKKGGDKSAVVFRDASKVPRRKPTMRKPTQSFVITLKRAYIESDRALLAFPHDFERANHYTGGATSFATGGRAQTIPSMAYVSSPQNDQVLRTPQHVSPYATVRPADYLPQGFLHSQDQFQYQPRQRATLPPYSRQQMHTGSPEYFRGVRHDLEQDRDSHDSTFTPDSLSPENAQVIGGPRRNLSSNGFQPNHRGQNTLEHSAEQNNNPTGHYAAGPNSPARHHRQSMNMSELFNQPLQAPTSSSTYRESQNQGAQGVRYRLSGQNNFIHKDELHDNYEVQPQIDAHPGQEAYPNMWNFNSTK